jgi:hypothetical protein
VDAGRSHITTTCGYADQLQRAAGFKINQVLPPALEADARVRTRGVGLRSLEGMGPKRFVLSVDDDTDSGHEINPVKKFTVILFA